jgi:hypothetical protein
LGIEQSLVVFTRKLGVDGQPHGCAVITSTGQLDGKVHPLVAARFGFHLLAVLLDGQHLLQQGLELHLAKNATGFHVA